MQNGTTHRVRSKRRKVRARGLTLVELMIVITLIGALMAVIAIGIFSKLASGEKETAKMGVDKMVGEVTLYQRSHPDVDCPSIDQMKAEASKDKFEGKDPWGQQYIIKCDAENVIVISKGPDKKENTADDIRSDQSTKK